MENTELHGLGSRILKDQEAADIDLGPLKLLQGKWIGKPFSGWNVISVPGEPTDGFVLEVIPYEETLEFAPAVVTAGNRGLFVNGAENQQDIVGLMYEQIVTSVCTSPLCEKRGFKSGKIIHAERGFFLWVKNFNSNFDIVRLSGVPHGNSVLALGQSFTGAPPDNNFIAKVSTLPTDMTHKPILDYGIDQFNKAQFPDFDQVNPNSFLTQALGKDKITAMTTLVLSTDNEDGGGVLNIPFIQQNIKATNLQSTFWIESLKNPKDDDPDILQLQYTQTINLVFPPTGSPTPVIWPHVTINTMRKVE